MLRGVIFAGVLAALFAGTAGADEALRRQAANLFGEIKPSTAAASPQAELGRALFWDERASLDGKTACASCHFARDWGADRRQFSPDARGALTGDDGALTERQKAGLRSFVSTGCAGCHNGPRLGGTMLSKFGVVKDYWLETGSQKIDQGRFAITKKEEDRYVFRVPMLRNAAKTAPYFHDGSVETLERAVRVMASVQLGRTLEDATVAELVSFLDSLTGEIPSNYAPPGQNLQK